MERDLILDPRDGRFVCTYGQKWVGEQLRATHQRVVHPHAKKIDGDCEWDEYHCPCCDTKWTVYYEE